MRSINHIYFLFLLISSLTSPVVSANSLTDYTIVDVEDQKGQSVIITLKTSSEDLLPKLILLLDGIPFQTSNSSPLDVLGFAPHSASTRCNTQFSSRSFFIG